MIDYIYKETDDFEHDLMRYHHELEMASILYESDNGKSPVIESLCEFLNKIVSLFKKLLDQISNGAKRILTKSKIKNNIKVLKHIAKHADDKEMIKFYDVNKYEQEFKNYVNTLEKTFNKTLLDEKYMKTITPEQAQRVITTFNRLNEQHAKKIEHIQTTLIDMKVKEVAKWVDERYESKDNNIVDCINRYNKKIIDIECKVKNLENDLNDYARRTGYILYPRTVREIVHNTSLYVKRNAEWLSITAVGVGITAVAGSTYALAIFRNGEEYPVKGSKIDYIKSSEFYSDMKKSAGEIGGTPLGMAGEIGIELGLGTIAAGQIERHSRDAIKKNSIYNK